MVLKSGYYHLTTVEYRSAAALVKGYCFWYLCFYFLKTYQELLYNA